jgi:hypothetical protein
MELPASTIYEIYTFEIRDIYIKDVIFFLMNKL